MKIKRILLPVTLLSATTLIATDVVSFDDQGINIDKKEAPQISDEVNNENIIEDESIQVRPLPEDGIDINTEPIEPTEPTTDTENTVTRYLGYQDVKYDTKQEAYDSFIIDEYEVNYNYKDQIANSKEELTNLMFNGLEEYNGYKGQLGYYDNVYSYVDNELSIRETYVNPAFEKPLTSDELLVYVNKQMPSTHNNSLIKEEKYMHFGSNITETSYLEWIESDIEEDRVETRERPHSESTLTCDEFSTQTIMNLFNVQPYVWNVMLNIGWVRSNCTSLNGRPAISFANISDTTYKSIREYKFYKINIENNGVRLFKTIEEAREHLYYHFISKSTKAITVNGELVMKSKEGYIDQLKQETIEYYKVDGIYSSNKDYIKNIISDKVENSHEDYIDFYRKRLRTGEVFKASTKYEVDKAIKDYIVIMSVEEKL